MRQYRGTSGRDVGRINYCECLFKPGIGRYIGYHYGYGYCLVRPNVYPERHFNPFAISSKIVGDSCAHTRSDSLRPAFSCVCACFVSLFMVSSTVTPSVWTRYTFSQTLPSFESTWLTLKVMLTKFN